MAEVPLHAQVYDKGFRCDPKYSVSCVHGDFVLDRLTKVQNFLGKHRACAPGWDALAPQSGEPEAEHAQRIRPLFPFSRVAGAPVVRVESRFARLSGAAGELPAP